jgi:hypothetical protein
VPFSLSRAVMEKVVRFRDISAPKNLKFYFIAMFE